MNDHNVQGKRIACFTAYANNFTHCDTSVQGEAETQEFHAIFEDRNAALLLKSTGLISADE
jgi:hypothetical protein